MLRRVRLHRLSAATSAREGRYDTIISTMSGMRNGVGLVIVVGDEARLATSLFHLIQFIGLSTFDSDSLKLLSRTRKPDVTVLL